MAQVTLTFNDPSVTSFTVPSDGGTKADSGDVTQSGGDGETAVVNVSGGDGVSPGILDGATHEAARKCYRALGIFRGSPD